VGEVLLTDPEVIAIFDKSDLPVRRYDDTKQRLTDIWNKANQPELAKQVKPEITEPVKKPPVISEKPAEVTAPLTAPPIKPVPPAKPPMPTPEIKPKTLPEKIGKIYERAEKQRFIAERPKRILEHARALQSEYESGITKSEFAKAVKGLGGIRNYKKSALTGKIELKEELSGMPRELRGNKSLDEMAQELYNKNVIKEPTENAVLKQIEIYKRLRLSMPKRKKFGEFMEEASKVITEEEVGIKIGRMVSEETIMSLIAKGQEQSAREAFVQGKRTGIFAQKEKYEDVVSRAKARKEIKTRFNKAKKTLYNIDTKHLRPEYKQQVKDIIDAINFVNSRPKTILKLQNMQEYIQTHPDNMIPPKKLQELSILNRKRISDYTVDEIEDVVHQVQHFVKLNQLKNKLIFGKQYQEASVIVREAQANIQKKPVAIRTDPNIIDLSIKEKQQGLFAKIFNILYGTESWNPELFTDILDRSPEKHGVIHKVLYKGLDEGVSEQLQYVFDVRDFLKEELTSVNIDYKNGLDSWSKAIGGEKKAEIQEIPLPSGKTIRMTKAERISIILHSLNDKNIRHMVNGGISPAAHRGITWQISPDDLQTIVDSATPQEKQVTDIIYKIFNDWIKPKLNKVSVELNGWEIATEDDYFPIRTNALDIKRDELKLSKNFTQNTLEGMGIFKERVNASNALIIEDVFTVLTKHVMKTSSYYGLAKPLRNAKMLLNDTGFQKNVVNVYGHGYLKALKDYLKDIEDHSHDTSGIGSLTTELMNKLDIAILGMNPFVAMKQPVSYVMAGTEMNIKYLVRAVARPTETTKSEMRKWSPQLRDRLEGNVTRELGELGRVGTVRKFVSDKNPIGRNAMFLIREGDFHAVGRIWNAVKLEIKDTHPGLTGDEFMKAVAERAEEVIRLTQPTFHLKDRSFIGRDPYWATRLLTKYTSQRNKNLNALRRSILKYDLSGKTNKDKTELMKNLFIILVVSSVSIEAINWLRDKTYRKKEKTAVARGVGVIGNNLSYMYFVGDIFSSLASKIERGTYAGWDMSNPASSFLNNAVDAIANTHRTIEQVISEERYKTGKKIGQLKWRTSALTAGDQIASIILKMRGVPYNTLKELITAPVKWTPEIKETLKDVYVE